MPNPLPTRLFKLYAPTLIASRDPVDGKLRIEGVASSSIKDRHGDQLTLKALRKMESSAIGLTIFMNHSYDIPKDVFGTVEKSKLRKSADVDKKGDPIYDLRFGITVASSNPEAVKSFELIETDKVQLGLSIGAMIPEGGASFEKGTTPADSRMLIDDVELVETSLIGIPANPRAWVDYAVKAFTGAYPDKVGQEKHLSILASLALDEEIPAVETDTEMEPVPETIETSAEDEVETTVVTLTAEDDAALDIIADGSGQHPHAHSHDHEHQHGYEGNLTVHGHDHAHVHSHEHDAEHNHASDMNDYQHDHSHSGSYDADHAHEDAEDTKKAAEPVLVKTTTVWDNEDEEAQTDTAKSVSEGVQSAQVPEGPETAGGLTDDSVGAVVASLDEDHIEALRVVAQTVDDQTGLVKAMHAQMVSARAEAATAREERDAALEVAKKALAGTQAIIEKIGDLPAGRKTGGVVAMQGEFDALKDIYGDDVRRLMTKKG